MAPSSLAQACSVNKELQNVCVCFLTLRRKMAESRFLNIFKKLSPKMCSHKYTSVFFCYFYWSKVDLSFPDGTSGKEPGCQYRRCKRGRFDHWVGKISSRRAWQPTPVFLPRESHRWRSVARLQSIGSHRVGHN